MLNNEPLADDEVISTAAAFDPTARITAIPTTYRGYTFRSRTEARWAVFFDSMGIEWEYEPEGLQLPSGERYLPDFYLPRFKVWAEVKPTHEISAQESKALLFASRAEMHILLLIGQPDFIGYLCLDGSFGTFEYSLDIYGHDSNLLSENRFWSCPYFYEDQSMESQFSDRYYQAVHASRKERFDEFKGSRS